MHSILKRLLQFFLIQVIALCLLVSVYFLNLQATLTLVIFNFLFSSLTFPLKGTMVRKLTMLTLGNFLGLFWNAVFYNFALAGTSYFGSAFDPFYILAYPILNLLWIVPFWSFSLGLLPRMQPAGAEVKK